MIDKLLPTKEELLPIKNDKNTFYECGFNEDFNNLTFEKQLQIICDIVRQSIHTNVFPNPSDSVLNMEGNCYTAAHVSKIYLEKLGLGKNIKIVFGRARSFEPTDNTTIHMLNLVEDENGDIYQFDATPFVGYGLGKVQKISKRLYQEYIEVNDEIDSLVKIFLEIIYNDHKGTFDENKINYYLNIINDSLSHEILNGYASKCLKILSEYMTYPEKEEVISLSNKLKKYSKSNEKAYLYRRGIIEIEIKSWEEELKELLLDNKNFKRQLELASNIIQEKKMFDTSFERYVIIKDKEYRMSFINPRVLRDLNINTIMIKPSAYYFGKEHFIEDRMLYPNKETFGRYTVDLSKPTEQTGIKPMLFSHPLGEEYIRSMMGSSTIMLVNDSADNLNKIKKELRNELGSDIWGKEFKWTDGKNILWHPYVTNFVHSADDYSETALHYLIAYPEHQLMTRFMYPNKKLTKEVNK